MRYELQPEHDSRKSFYHKAVVEYHEDGIEEGIQDLYSYNTHVATYFSETGVIKVFGLYSATTLRHIKEFIYQLTGEVLSKTEIEKRYMTNA